MSAIIVGVVTTQLTGASTTIALTSGYSLAPGDDIWLLCECDSSGVIFSALADWRYMTAADGSFGGDGQSARVMRLAYGASGGTGGGTGGAFGYNGTTPNLVIQNTNATSLGTVTAVVVRGVDITGTVLGLSPAVSSASQPSPQSVSTNAISPSGGECGIIFNVVDTTSGSDTWNVSPPSGWTEQDETQGSFFHAQICTQENLAAGAGVTYTSTYARTGGSTNLAGRYSMVFALPSAGGPTITTPVASQHVAPGATPTLTASASASGGGTLSWQAKINGSPISGASGSGASASYTFSAALALSDNLSAFSFEFSETGGTSPGTASTTATIYVGPRFMGASAIVYGTATLAPSYTVNGATPQAGDLAVIDVGQKPSTANSGSVTTPASPWALEASLTAAGGYGTTLGADTGNTNLSRFARQCDGTETGTQSISLTGSNSAWAMLQLWRPPPGYTLSLTSVTGSKTTSGNLSITPASDPGVTSGDYLVAAFCDPTDINISGGAGNNLSASAFSQTGVTFATAVEIAEPASGTGNDIGGLEAYALATAGTSSGAPTWTATATTGTNVRGPAIISRLRATATGGGTSTDSVGARSLGASGVTTAATSISSGGFGGRGGSGCPTIVVTAGVVGSAWRGRSGAPLESPVAAQVGARTRAAFGAITEAVSTGTPGTASRGASGASSSAATPTMAGAASACRSGSPRTVLSAIMPGARSLGAYGSTQEVTQLIVAATGARSLGASGAPTAAVTVPVCSSGGRQPSGAPAPVPAVRPVGARSVASLGAVVDGPVVAASGARGAGRSGSPSELAFLASSGTRSLAGYGPTVEAVGLVVTSAAGARSLGASGAPRATPSASVSGARGGAVGSTSLGAGVQVAGARSLGRAGPTSELVVTIVAPAGARSLGASGATFVAVTAPQSGARSAAASGATYPTLISRGVGARSPARAGSAIAVPVASLAGSRTLSVAAPFTVGGVVVRTDGSRSLAGYGPVIVRVGVFTSSAGARSLGASGSARSIPLVRVSGARSAGRIGAALSGEFGISRIGVIPIGGASAAVQAGSASVAVTQLGLVTVVLTPVGFVSVEVKPA